ncbi:hypothetical protein BT69DRAFT_1277853 [Atractiella rhizophila]|nr:hypothetical protein BT69DRAFT_1277853 [Atractiella rhizophila]
MSSTNPSWNNVSLLGGYPLHGQDTAASSVFLAAYTLLLPVALWRFMKPESRTKFLIYLVLFILIRMTTFIIRLVISEHEGRIDTGVIVGEQVLLSTGYIALVSTIFDLFFRYKLVGLVEHPGSRKDMIRRVLGWVSAQALEAAVICAIVAASRYSSSKRGSVRTLRVVSASLTLGALGLVLALIVPVLVFTSKNKVYGSRKSTLLLLAGDLILLIVPIYRLVKGTGTTSLFALGGKVEFYLLQILPEFLVTALLLLPNLRQLFEIVAVDEEEKAWMKKRYPDGRGILRRYLGAGYF